MPLPCGSTWPPQDPRCGASRGQHLTITAGGAISFIGGGPLVDPDGATDLHPGVCVLPGPDHHAALIGRIISVNPGPPFLVGQSYDQIVDRDGLLILGINDIGGDNNSGEFAAIVQVS